jgi:hypothetical protein
MKSEPDEPPSQLAFWVLLASWLAIAVAIVILLFQEDSHATPAAQKVSAIEKHIWFQLLRYHEGKIFWMGAWETQQECEKARDWYLYEQTDYVGDAFSCPHVTVLKV